jgi:phospholipid/cholesterol/gamma-HCH transport system substrate-binding protein
VTSQLQTEDRSVAGFFDDGGPAAAEARQLFERLQPTLPIVLANLVSIGQVAVTYQPSIEQLLVLLPQGVASLQGIAAANADTKQDYKGAYLSFNLNLNLPPVCSTGFLPAQQRRAPNFEDYPNRAPGDLYCRTPQDSPFNVRGARNLPCETIPGKRAPTVKLCESDENFVPLNDGYNWKGDPNATLSGQGIPDLAPAVAPDRGRPVRPRHRQLRRAGRACLHPDRPGPDRTEGADMAIDVDASERQLTVPPVTGRDEAPAHRRSDLRAAVATVPGEASVSASENRSVVLVFVDQTITVAGGAPSNTASTVKVSLDKIGDQWLVSGFDPV